MTSRCMNKERLLSVDCPDCDGFNTRCDYFIPSSIPHHKPYIQRYERHTRILPRSYQDWIRQINDRGVI